MNYADMIRGNLHNPEELEKLYRQDAAGFSVGLEQVYAEAPESPVLQVWKARLKFERANGEVARAANASAVARGAGKLERGAEPVGVEHAVGQRRIDVIVILLLCLLGGSVVKILNEAHFYGNGSTFVCFGVMPFVALYFLRRRHLSWRFGAGIFGVVLFSLIYLIFLDQRGYGSVADLAYLHLPVFLWGMVALAFLGREWVDLERRMDFIRYNGELAIYAGVLGIGVVALSGVFMGLFERVDATLVNFYTNTILLYLMTSVPIVATYLTDLRKNLLVNILPMVAKIFSSLLLAMVVFFLGSIFFVGKNPFTEREFLMSVDLLLVAVLGLIIFIHSGQRNEEGLASKRREWSDYVNYALCVATVLVDVIALAAIVFRFASYGISPNRIAVLGLNVLVLLNLVGVIWRYTQASCKGEGLAGVKRMIAAYLPVYVAWCLVVTVVLPLVFGK